MKDANERARIFISPIPKTKGIFEYRLRHEGMAAPLFWKSPLPVTAMTILPQVILPINVEAEERTPTPSFGDIVRESTNRASEYDFRIYVFLLGGENHRGICAVQNPSRSSANQGMIVPNQCLRKYRLANSLSPSGLLVCSHCRRSYA
jgi:hypothetical protein